MSTDAPNATTAVVQSAIVTAPAVLPVNPHTVISPKAMVANVVVIHDGRGYADGPLANWSCATLDWEDGPAVGLRWDGGEGQPCGMPQSRGIPIWFVVPDALSGIVLQAVRQLLEDHGDTAKSLRSAVNELIYAARRASPEELARLRTSLAA